MTNQISEWGRYSELLSQLNSLSLDWSSWSNLTLSIINANPGLWGAVPENALFGYGLAELIGEIYSVPPTDVDLDNPAEFHARDEQVLSMLWHVLYAQPATEMSGYEGWNGYFLCWESDDSLTYATARDADQWEPVPVAEEAEAEQDWGGADDVPLGPVFTAWGDYWIKDEDGRRWFGESNPDGPWYSTADEFGATLLRVTPEQADPDDIGATMKKLVAENLDFAGISDERRAEIINMARELVGLSSTGSGD